MQNWVHDAIIIRDGRLKDTMLTNLPVPYDFWISLGTYSMIVQLRRLIVYSTNDKSEAVSVDGVTLPLIILI